MHKATWLAFVPIALVAALPAACSSSSSPAAAADSAIDAGPATVANGTIGAWAVAQPMPLPRGNHCSVFANGYLVVIGGNYTPAGSTTFQNIDEIDVAKLNDDGTLGAWQVAGKTPSPVNSCTAAASGDTIVLIDGIYDDDKLSGKPLAATIGADGTLTPFTALAPLPAGVRVLYSTALIADGTLYTMFSRLPTDGDDVSLLTTAADPLPPPFASAREQKWLPGFRGHPAYAFAPPFVYSIGGYGSATDAGNVVLADGHGTKLDATGAAGTPFDLAPLPQPTTSASAIAVDSWLFVVGGKGDVFAGDGRGDVLAGSIGADGSVASWSSLASLPEGRTALAVAAGGDYLFVTGGGYKGAGLDTTFVAKVRFPR